MQMVRTAFPDIESNINEMIVGDDKVVHRATTTGTHKGEFMGIPPTDKRATWEEMHILRFDNGKAVEHWTIMDRLGMMQQIGAV